MCPSWGCEETRNDEWYYSIWQGRSITYCLLWILLDISLVVLLTVFLGLITTSQRPFDIWEKIMQYISVTQFVPFFFTDYQHELKSEIMLLYTVRFPHQDWKRSEIQQVRWVEPRDRRFLSSQCKHKTFYVFNSFSFILEQSMSRNKVWYVYSTSCWIADIRK